MKIISATERLAERRGAKILILGPAKIGKTSLLRTVAPERVLFVDLEAGDQAVLDVPIATLRPQTWDECRNLACYLTGPNPNLPPHVAYSGAHYEAVKPEFESMHLDQFETYFIDSVSVAARICWSWCEQQPEATAEKTGRRDTRALYGLLAHQMIGWLTHLQYARAKNIVLIAVLESIADEFRRREWSIQIEGQKTARELVAIVDQILTLNFLDFDDGQPPTRGFVCTTPNLWGYPAGDRSGRLEQIEPPHLGLLIKKLTEREVRRKPFTSPTTTRAAE